MAADWFYSTNKQQMGPVSWDELRQLAASGSLQRDDLVWSEGMAEWIKAERQAGLFTAAAAGVRAEPPAPPPAPTSAKARRPDEDRDERGTEESRGRKREQDRDDRPSEKGRARRKGGGGPSAGLLIGVGVGAVALIFLVLACGGIGILIWYLVDSAASPVGPAGVNYTVDLRQGGDDRRAFTLRAGQRVTIIVTTTRVAGFIQPNVDLFVVRGGITIAQDTRVHPDCLVVFVAPANDTYSVRISNLGPGRAASRVVITAN
jgi:GYF domain 2